MPHAVTAVAPGLQALILCGPGSSFPTFTTNPDENPKALLPIANRPMVWYPLSFCYRVGITDITLICPPTAEEALNASLKTNPFLTSLPLPTPTLLAPKDLTYNTGTADILRLPEVREAVTQNFFVLPCDLVCELGGDQLVQAWMVKSAKLDGMFTEQQSTHEPRSGGLGVWYDTKASPIKGEETDFVITTPSPKLPVAPPKDSVLTRLQNVVYSMPKDTLNDITDDNEGFPIRHGLLRAHSRIRMVSSHRDAHIYIFPHWVMDLVKENPHMESIAEDVVGWWAKATWQSGLGTKLGLDRILGTSSDEQSSETSQTSSPSTPTKADRPTLPKRLSSVPDKFQVPHMTAYIHPSGPTDPLIRRVDTAQALLSVSLQLAKLPSLEETGIAAATSPFAHSRKVAYPEGVRPRTTITRPDSLVADNVIVEEKVSIKESVIGANCKIEEGAKLQGCLLMDGVVVGKGCRLVRCILGKRSQIGEGSTLMECEVQENLLVEPKTEEKNTKIMSSSGLEATEEEMQEVLEAMSDVEIGDEAQ
ncbi:hypothetical protein MCOR25_005033 [Pyricularia grisea]|nr:hypothetical protein MCOR25_005033 [Pyricularia grisea]